MNKHTEDCLDLGLLENILAAREIVESSDLVPLLQNIQDAYGYLPRDVLLEMSRRTGLPAGRIYGVATFYEQFYLEPHGRHTVRCCRGTACHVRGGHETIEAIKRVLGISEGQTTEDMRFTFETVACLGTCALAPVMVIDDTYYGSVTPGRVETIIEELRSATEETA